jgi:2-oxo-3-hexenedioate decarboxylase
MFQGVTAAMGHGYTPAMPNTARLADDVLSALSSRRQIAPLTSTVGLDVAQAYRVSRAVTARRVAHGEVVVGRKIGFTNRTIWDEYGVHKPIYGPVYDSTLREVQGMIGGVSLAALVEPRIEPEIVLGLSSAPEAGMDATALMDCIGWVAHGFEIVQSLFPGWVFKVEDCIAAFGLHGALLLGPRRLLGDHERADWLVRLGDFSVHLSRDGLDVDVGHASNVLDGPVHALRHLVETLAADADASPLRAGEMITTGTVTRAFPILPGERWTTRLVGLDLPGMDVTFA